MDKSLTLPSKPHRARGLPLLAAGLVALVGAAHAQTPQAPRGSDKASDSLRPLLGAWDLERVGASRKCTITLGAEPAGNGRKVRFPAICRRALPLLDQVAAWSVTPEGAPRLDDSSGKSVLAFGRTGAEAGLQGKATDGQEYRLDSKDYPRAARRAPPSPAEVAALAAQRPTAVDPARAPAADTLPGRYSVMRQQNREACKLLLTPGPADRAPAALEGQCQDTGLTIFDPAGWRYAAGRLTLIARKGHGLDLVFESGLWRKDPAVGAPLMMRKLAP